MHSGFKFQAHLFCIYDTLRKNTQRAECVSDIFNVIAPLDQAFSNFCWHTTKWNFTITNYNQ